MAALAGDHIVVKFDNASGTLQTFADGDISMVNVGQTYQQHDVSGFGDEVKKFINGQIQAPVTVKGYFTTDSTVGTHTLFSAALADGLARTLEVEVGQNATPQAGDPKYAGEFIVESYKPTIENGSAVMFEATLKPATGTAPAWTTV